MSSQLFSQLNDIWKSSKNLTSETKPDSIYMLNRFISLNSDGFLPANDCNNTIHIPDWASLLFLKYSTPTRTPPRNTYPKKLTKDIKLTPKKKVVLQRICKKFNVSEFHGTQIVKLLEQQGFKLEAN